MRIITFFLAWILTVTIATSGIVAAKATTPPAIEELLIVDKGKTTAIIVVAAKSGKVSRCNFGKAIKPSTMNS